MRAALNSGDPNRVLLAFAKRTAIELYFHSLNAVTASKLTDAELRQLKGLSPAAVPNIRRAMNTVAKEQQPGIGVFSVF
jgi:hypothetical protein